MIHNLFLHSRKQFSNIDFPSFCVDVTAGTAALLTLVKPHTNASAATARTVIGGELKSNQIFFIGTCSITHFAVPFITYDTL